MYFASYPGALQAMILSPPRIIRSAVLTANTRSPRNKTSCWKMRRQFQNKSLNEISLTQFRNYESDILMCRQQIQLEKIRSSETEVRWQHEEDVEECTNCKVSFTVTKRKVRGSGNTPPRPRLTTRSHRQRIIFVSFLARERWGNSGEPPPPPQHQDFDSLFMRATNE